MKQLTVDNVKVGDTFEKVVVDNLTRTRIVQYAGASGDYNPIHTDEVFAKQVAGYPTVFAHGMLTMGLTGTLVTDLIPADALTEFGVRFVAQVWPGDTLTTKATVEAVESDGENTIVTLAIDTYNNKGVVVVRGTAKGRLS